MKIKGIKRGQTIELTEAINLADGEEVILEIPDQQLSTEKLGFGDSILKFRQVHHLDMEGIEPEDWLQDVQDKTPGREVNW
jgi:antitoxin component of MazEF toxin-antitoxin module